MNRKTLTLLMMTLVSPAAHVSAANFTCNDPQIRDAAERARVRSAIFWTGQPFARDWSSPCPIDVRLANHRGGGVTSYRFDRGEVFGWTMCVAGTREAILRDVIPHEVDHMVRASIVRRPLPRWLDEGCAILMESPAEQDRQRQTVRRLGEFFIDAAFLDAGEYPPAAEQARLYAVGFSLVEFLLARRDARTLMRFQTDARPPSQKLYEFYGVTTAEVSAEWNRSIHRFAVDADAEATNQETMNRQALVVWSSQACVPCRRFWSDFKSDASFRELLAGRFQIRAVDADRQPALMQQHGVEALPTFVIGQRRIIGYEGQAWLLARLGLSTIAEAATPPSAPSPDQTRPLTRIPLPTTATDDAETADEPTEDSLALAPLEKRAEPSAKRSIGWPGIVNLAPAALQVARWTGLIGTGAATGGVGALAFWALTTVIRRRREGSSFRSRQSRDPLTTEDSHPVRTPFPRRLDETRQLLELRQREGRVAALDALVGMFTQDELTKLEARGSPQEVALAQQLRADIFTRVDDVAPIAT